MNPYSEKLTPAMKNFISKQAISSGKKSAEAIRTSLIHTFNLPSDYISGRRVSTLCREARRATRRATREKPSKVMITDDPVVNVLNKQISTLKKKITHEKLRETLKGVEGKKSEDPLFELREIVEYQQLSTQLAKVDTTKALNMLKELDSMIEEDLPRSSMLEDLQALQEMRLINTSRADHSPLANALVRGFQQLNRESKEYRETVEELRDTTEKERLDTLNKEMNLKLAMIQRGKMTVGDWENLQRKRHEWAKEQGYVQSSENDPREKSKDRLVNQTMKRLEETPEKIATSFNKSVDKFVASLEKTQEKRRIFAQRRHAHRNRPQSPTPVFTPPSSLPSNKDFSQGLGENFDLWEILAVPSTKKKKETKNLIKF